MFTVKVCEARNNDETVFEAKGVRKGLNPERSADERFIGKVICDLPGGGEISYDIRSATPVDGHDDRRMYVMNSAGATVTTYDL